jgi:hypothetical protein
MFWKVLVAKNLVQSILRNKNFPKHELASTMEQKLLLDATDRAKARSI